MPGLTLPKPTTAEITQLRNSRFYFERLNCLPLFYDREIKLLWIESKEKGKEPIGENESPKKKKGSVVTREYSFFYSGWLCMHRQRVLVFRQ